MRKELYCYHQLSVWQLTFLRLIIFNVTKFAHFLWHFCLKFIYKSNLSLFGAVYLRELSNKYILVFCFVYSKLRCNKMLVADSLSHQLHLSRCSLSYYTVWLVDRGPDILKFSTCPWHCLSPTLVMKYILRSYIYHDLSPKTLYIIMFEEKQKEKRLGCCLKNKCRNWFILFLEKSSEVNVSNTFEGLGQSHVSQCVTSPLLKMLHLGTGKNSCSFETEMFSNSCLECKSYKTLKAEMACKRLHSVFNLYFANCPDLFWKRGCTVLLYCTVCLKIGKNLQFPLAHIWFSLMALRFT